jgi:hypothetical protein
MNEDLIYQLLLLHSLHLVNPIENKNYIFDFNETANVLVYWRK